MNNLINKIKRLFYVGKKIADTEITFSKNEASENNEATKVALDRQTEILYFLSDAVHNLENPFLLKEGIEPDDEFYKKIAYVFSYTRVLSLNIKDKRYSKEEYEAILNFIKIDFLSFCYHKTNILDTERYLDLIKVQK